MAQTDGRNYIVRRLTPLECSRLQGFPDWWMSDTGGSQSARYKMWGNGIALPCACDVLWRIAHADELCTPSDSTTPAAPHRLSFDELFALLEDE